MSVHTRGLGKNMDEKRNRGKSSAPSAWMTTGGHTGVTTTTDTGAARGGGCTGSTGGAGHAGGEGDAPAATEGGIAEVRFWGSVLLPTR